MLYNVRTYLRKEKSSNKKNHQNGIFPQIGPSMSRNLLKCTFRALVAYNMNTCQFFSGEAHNVNNVRRILLHFYSYRITKGANMRLATDFFSLRPIRKISSNISAGLRSKARNSSSQGGRSSVSGHRISVRSRAASQQENISEIVDLDGSVDRKCSLSRGVSTRFSPPSFLGSFLSAKVGSSETPVVNTKVSNISTKSVKSMSPTITVDKENSAAETLKQENAEVVEKIITEEPEVSVGTEIKT